MDTWQLFQTGKCNRNVEPPRLAFSRKENKWFRLCLFFKIVYRLVALDLPPYVQHPTRISHKNSHPLVFRQIHTGDYYINTRSTPSQSCNGIGCHPKSHYCPLSSPLKGQYAQSVTQCHKCQCAVLSFKFHGTLNSLTPLSSTILTETFLSL